MADFLTELRHAIRSALTEDVQPQALVVMTPLVGDKPEYESYVRVVGFDRAMSRTATGFGSAEEKELGAWKVLGLPDRSATGFSEPSPWMAFMDWLWGFLKDKDLKPMPYRGFGDVTKPYGKLSVHGKRQRKYGEGITGEYDVKRDITIVVNTLGNDQDEVTRKFDELIKAAKTPDWFYISVDQVNSRWYVIANLDVEVPEGYRERIASIEAYKRENREKFDNAVKKLAAGRTNYVQLKPLIARYLVVKHGFSAPFNIDIMDQATFEKAITTIGTLSLEELHQFAVEKKLTPPTIAKTAHDTMTIETLLQRWNSTVSRIADDGSVDPYVVQVALADYMTKHAGFRDPFDPTTLSPAALARAVMIASQLGFDDIRELLESIQRQIAAIIEATKIVNSD